MSLISNRIDEESIKGRSMFGSLLSFLDYRVDYSLICHYDTNKGVPSPITEEEAKYLVSDVNRGATILSVLISIVAFVVSVSLMLYFEIFSAGISSIIAIVLGIAIGVIIKYGLAGVVEKRSKIMFNDIKVATIYPSCKKAFCIEHIDEITTRENLSDMDGINNTTIFFHQGEVEVHWQCKECGKSGSGKVKFRNVHTV
mgnify:CR=1 FL=1